MEVAQNYAFRMGRPLTDIDKDLPTVGMYGIGMKRAIFKLGRSAVVRTHQGNHAYEVSIPPKWFSEQDNWELPLQMLTVSTLSEKGTEIEVSNLLEDVQRYFSEHSDFAESLRAKIATHFSFIMSKGFEITVNKTPVTPRPLHLLMAPPEGTKARQKKDSSRLMPFIYEGTVEGVEVQLYVGLYKPTPSLDDDEAEHQSKRTKDDAGWTVICNDRVILYCDKTRLTGWGEATVPSFHPQFNAITGIVIFKSNDATKLPVTTTKRGIDGGSQIYLYVKEYMREGTKIFTSYTYKWKTHAEEERKQSGAAKSLSLDDIDKQIPEKSWQKLRARPGLTKASSERKISPTLPSPAAQGEKEQFIRFAKPLKQIRKLADHIFDDPEHPPGEVGSHCFDSVFQSISGKKK